MQNNIPSPSPRTWTLKELHSPEAKSKHKWIIIRDQVYDLKDWIDRHPGGDLVITHCLYQDSTIQFTRMHPPSVDRMLPTFFIGKLDENEAKGLISHSPLNEEFLQTERVLREKGFYDYENSNFFYIRELVKCFLFMTLSVLSVLYGPHTTINYLMAAFFMAIFWHQLAFVGHDTGHNAVSGFKPFDHFLGICAGNTFGGVSIGWWKDSHNVHHVITNDPEHDPDIQHLPFMAVTTRFFKNVYSSYHGKTLIFDAASRVLVKVQHYTYYIIMMLARFNLYVQGIIFILTNKRCKYRPYEAVGIAFFFCWFVPFVSCIEGAGNKVLFLLVSHAMAGLLHVQITISHFSMCTEPTIENEEFFKHQLRTTMDVDCPEWLDWLHGGLQFQVIHHCFPRMPRKNLRKAREYVLMLCKKFGVHYKSYNFISGNITVINHLKMISSKIN